MPHVKLTSLLKEVLEWKDIPDDEIQEAQKLIDDHNNGSAIDKGIKGHYAIDVTGKHQVYYTFWRWKEDIDPRIAAFIKNPIYMGNLTTNYLSSVKKALERTPKSTRVEIYTEGTRQHLIGKPERFTFGKYRGQSYYEVYLKDPGYFAYLNKNADPQYANTKSSLAIKLFAEMYFEEQTRKNVETSTSKFVGNVGDSFAGELTVYRVDQKEGHDFMTGRPKMYKVYKLLDSDGNKFVAFDLEKYFPQIQNDTQIKVKAKIKAHKELMGIKFTALNYVRQN